MTISHHDSQIICLVSKCSPKEVRIAKVSASSAGYHLWHFTSCDQLLCFNDIHDKSPDVFIDLECIEPETSLIGIRRLARTLSFYSHNPDSETKPIIDEVFKYADSLFRSTPFDKSFDLEYLFSRKNHQRKLIRAVDECPKHTPLKVKNFLSTGKLGQQSFNLKGIKISIAVSFMEYTFQCDGFSSINKTAETAKLILSLIPSWASARLTARINHDCTDYILCISTIMPYASRSNKHCFQIQQDVKNLSSIKCVEDESEDELEQAKDIEVAS